MEDTTANSKDVKNGRSELPGQVPHCGLRVFELRTHFAQTLIAIDENFDAWQITAGNGCAQPKRRYFGPFTAVTSIPENVAKKLGFQGHTSDVDAAKAAIELGVSTDYMHRLLIERRVLGASNHGKGWVIPSPVIIRPVRKLYP